MPQDDQRNAIEPENIMPASIKDVEIQTIPDKFYGAALSARIAEAKTSGAKGAPVPKGGRPDAVPKRRRSLTPIVVMVVLLIFGVGGGFIFFNRQLLFKPPNSTTTTPEPPKPPPPPPPPSAPTDLTALATSPSIVQLSWKDASSNEAGFRVERRDPASSYVSVTSLPPNSTAYQDQSISASSTYLYRIIALNEGGESPASNEAAVTTPPPVPPPPMPPTLPPAGLDSDSDGLTDLEEPLYGANLKDPDSDHDSFNDGNEVFHLYNPASGKNAKLLESSLVKIVQSPVGWKLYVPITWKADVSADGMKGTFTPGNGETFTITFENNPEKLKIMDWYLAQYPGTLSSQAVLKTTKSGVEGLVGIDPLKTYFPWGDKVLVFTYDLDGKPFVNYRTTYEMMQNSIALSVLPILPESPAVSSYPEPEPGSTAPASVGGTAVPVPAEPTPPSGTDLDLPLPPVLPILPAPTPSNPPPAPPLPSTQ